MEEKTISKSSWQFRLVDFVFPITNCWQHQPKNMCSMYLYILMAAILSPVIWFFQKLYLAAPHSIVAEAISGVFKNRDFFGWLKPLMLFLILFANYMILFLYTTIIILLYFRKLEVEIEMSGLEFAYVSIVFSIAWPIISSPFMYLFRKAKVKVCSKVKFE